ncbi:MULTISPECIES: hypothetical protein [Lactobacillus]|uniref:hypothetical protein n=1 Tax=Lactobacillus TaxID=1578 RepID=UPI00248FD0FB|nr:MULTISPECIES: hypothetical protein [Lactobacillus]
MRNREKEIALEFWQLGKVRITVSDYCKSQKIGRNSFYSMYNSITDIIYLILRNDMMIGMSHADNELIDRALENCLRMLYKNHQFYLWLYNQRKHSERLIIKHRLIKDLKEIIHRFAMDNDGISTVELNRVAEEIYEKLFCQVIHGCDRDFLEISNELKRHVLAIKGLRCPCVGYQKRG